MNVAIVVRVVEFVLVASVLIHMAIVKGRRLQISIVSELKFNDAFV